MHGQSVGHSACQDGGRALPPAPRPSESVLYPQLNLPRRLIPVSVPREHLPKIRTPKHAVRYIEVRMVQQVEDLSAELQTTTLFAQHEVLVQREIQVLQPRPGHDIAASIA